VTYDSISAPVPGSRDRINQEVAIAQALQSTLQRHLASYGYRMADLPLLERTDLYLRKLGSEVAARMFGLTDQRGDRLSLRPEFTGSVIRAYLGHAGAPLPIRWQYCGPVFRDRDAANGDLRQFTQLGCELIGATGPRADAELIAAAACGLQAVGVIRPRIVIGHAGLAPALLAELGISERARLYIAAHLDLVREGPAGVEALRSELLDLSRPPAELGIDLDAGRAAATSLIQWFLAEGTKRSTGRRTSDDIVRRFRDKVLGADTPVQLERAISLVRQLTAVVAAPAEALRQGEAVAAAFGLAAQPLAELRQVVELLAAHDLEGVHLQVDLGLHRPLGYYTGVVFELYGNDGAALGGGGRYDGLVRALGGGDVAALGFAYEVERLEASFAAIAATGSAPSGVLVVAATDADYPAAVRQAQTLRDTGASVELEVTSRTETERTAYCRTAGIARVLTVSATGVAEAAIQTERQYA